MSARISRKLAEAIKALGELLEGLLPKGPAPELVPVPVEARRKPPRQRQG